MRSAPAIPAGVSAVIDQFPALKSHLDAPLIGNSFGITPLVQAATKGNVQLIDLLLSAGADINARTQWWAGSFGVLDTAPVELAPLLIERGARLDVHSASRLNRVAELAALLDVNPLLVNARGGDGQTPLHFAASVEAAALLLERGAHIDARDIDHESTPAQYMLRDRKLVARFLVSKGCETDILMAAALGELELVRKHLAADPKSIYIAVSDRYFPKINPESGGTIYLWTVGLFKTAHALAHENPEIAELLTAHTPPDLHLLLAAQANDRELVETLLTQSPAFESELLTATALHWAAWHGNIRMTDALLKRNAPLETNDAQYHMPPIGWAQHASGMGRPTPGADFPGTIATLQAAGARAVGR